MANARTYQESADVERPPAFQEYAAQALTAESFRLLSLGERGMLATLKYYCWCNDSAPADPMQLARALGLQEADVHEHFTHAVRAFFEPAEDDSTRIVCPALVRQMERLMMRREAQAQSGRDSARKRREKKNPQRGNRHGNRDGYRIRASNGLEDKKAQESKDQLCKGADESTPSPARGNGGTDPFVVELEAAEARERAGGA